MNKMNSQSFYLLSYISYSMMMMILMLISVAFFTLFERKFLSYIHKRKGPNKATMIGLTQPFADALKLLSKEFLFSSKILYDIYIISPMMMLLITMLLWLLFPNNMFSYHINNSLLFILCCLSVSIYPIMIGGWSSNSVYALLGSMRGLAQTISYEVSFAVIMICPMIMCETMNLYYFWDFQQIFPFSLWLWPSMIMLYISSLAEVNRTPFDFIEGESELVSGFNIEYSGSGFTLIFLAEYAMILWISGFISIMFFSSKSFLCFALIIAFSMIWVRGTLPRMRYDELMYLCWKIFLPCSISLLSYAIIIKYYNSMIM